MEECDLVDLYTTIKQDNSQFGTQARGSKKIDYMLGSRNVIPFIKNIGYVTFNDAFDSDHRAVFADISNSILEDPINKQQPRIRLVGTNSTNVEGERYIRHLHNYLNKYDMFNKVARLEQHAKDNSKPNVEIMEKLNKYDTIITDAMIKYEKSTCSEKDRAYWSPELEQSNLFVQFWNILYKSICQQFDASKRLEKICQHLDRSMKLLICDSTSPVKTALRNALKQHKELIKEHYKYREQHLQKIVDDENARECTNGIMTIQKLLRRERKRQDHSYIRRLIKNKDTKGLTVLEIPNPENEDEWIEISDPVTIENNLIDKSVTHFSQANEAPFCQSPLIELFGYEGTNDNMMDMIKKGLIPIEIRQQPMYVNKLLERLASGNNLPEITKDISLDDFIQGLHKWNERTTTSPSGRHLGHYKILIRLKVLDDKDETINLSYEILKLYYMVCNIAILMGGSLTRWKNITTCMIQKVPGNNRINKLRVIHLYEADYNLLLKLMWARTGVWHMNDNQAIHEGQAGSRPGKRAIDVVLQKEMKYLYATLTRTPLGTIDNDATSCYDRIICSLAIGISTYYGIPLKFCKMLAENLKGSVFRLRTALGDSVQTYQHSPTTPVHGSGQGSCVSPALWLMQSSFMMDIMEEIAHGMKMISVDDEDEPLKQYQEGFVDDISNYTNNEFKDLCIENLHNNLQEDGRKWVGLLEGTGGKLELTKCFYYLLSWGWDKTGSPYPQKISEQPQGLNKINIRDNSASPEYIQQKEVEESHRTLGVHKSICGREDDHLKVLTEKSNNIIARVWSGQLNRRQARMAYNCNYIPAMVYSLPATCLSEKKLYSVICKAICKFLQIHGYEERFPRAAVFGPFIYGGIGLRHIFTEGMCIKIESLICHINFVTSLGKSMKNNIQWIHILLGVGTPLLESDQVIHILPMNWFINIREFLNIIKAKIKIRNVWQPILLHQGDFFIMEKINRITITNRDRIIINNWRIYLQVLTLSDLTNNTGDKILPHYLFRNKVHEWSPKSKYKWPHQERPPLDTFRIWKKYIVRITACDSCGNLITTRLGDWFPDWNKTIRIKSAINIHQDTLIVFCDLLQSWKIYQKTGQQYSYHLFDKNTVRILEDIDTNKFSPINVSETALSYRVYSRNIPGIQYAPIHSAPILHRNFHEFLTTTTGHLKPLLRHYTITGSFPDRVNSSDKLVMCCDGSLRTGIGGYGVTFSLNENMAITTRMKITPGYNKFTSYRCEAYGMLGALALYDAIQEYMKIKHGNRVQTEIILCCDNEGLVKTVAALRQRPITPKFYYSTDADIIHEIMLLLLKFRQHNENVAIKHIKGHQDRNTTTLSHAALMNIEADRIASTALTIPRSEKVDPIHTNATLYINDLPVTSNHTAILREAFQLVALRAHYTSSNDWEPETFDKVWWVPHGMALSMLSTGEQTTTQKYLQNRLPCNRRQHLYYEYISDKCATCGELEVQAHIFRCEQCGVRQDTRNKYIQKLRSYLENSRVNEITARVIVSSVGAYLAGYDAPELEDFTTDPSPLLVRAMAEQDDIGWGQWFKGRISKTWEQLYAIDLATTDHQLRHQTPEKWGKTLIFDVFQFVLSTWTTRNEIEHGTNSDPLAVKKQKLVNKIMWMRQKVQFVPSRYLRNLKEEELIKLPIDNLLMTESQLEMLVRASKRKTGVPRDTSIE
jgi:hypothetical protein